MTTRLLTLVLTLSCAASAFAQTVPRTQRSLVMKVTATWCSPCGGYGWDLFEGLNEDLDERAITLAAHIQGSDLENEASLAIAGNANATGRPQFFVNTERQSASSSTVAASQSAIVTKVNEAASEPAEVGVLLQRTSDTDLTTTVEFFAAQAGTYNVAVYAIENDIVNAQASRGPDAVHKRILRGALNGDFGEAVVTGSAGEGMRVTQTAMVSAIDGAWEADNLVVVAVVWEALPDGKFRFVNGFELDDWQSVTSATPADLSADGFELRSISEAGQLSTWVTFGLSAKHARLELVDAQGRVLAVRELGQQPTGQTRITWTGQVLPKGYYAIRLSTDAGTLTRGTVLR